MDINGGSSQVLVPDNQTGTGLEGVVGRRL